MVAMKNLNYIYFFENNMTEQKYVIKNLLRPNFSLEDERSYWRTILDLILTGREELLKYLVWKDEIKSLSGE